VHTAGPARSWFVRAKKYADKFDPRGLRDAFRSESGESVESVERDQQKRHAFAQGPSLLLLWLLYFLFTAAGDKSTCKQGFRGPISKAADGMDSAALNAALASAKAAALAAGK